MSDDAAREDAAREDAARGDAARDDAAREDAATQPERRPTQPQAPCELPALPAVWEQDFPHTVEGEEAITRRAFTRYLVAGSGAFAASTVGAAAWTWLRDLPVGSRQQIIDSADIGPGESHLFRYPGPHDPAIMVRLPDGELAAYSQKCTHLGCVVYWDKESTELVCPCHEGIFDARDGVPTAGPPERPLPRIDLEVSETAVWALRVER